MKLFDSSSTSTNVTISVVLKSENSVQNVHRRPRCMPRWRRLQQWWWH